jgi:hypothetical protein
MLRVFENRMLRACMNLMREVIDIGESCIVRSSMIVILQLMLVLLSA